MRAQRFFRYLWRVNAVLIAVAAAGIAVAVVMVTVSTIQDNIHRREAAAAAVIPGKPANKELSLGGLSTTPAGDDAVLFQKNRKYYLALFDRTARAKKSEREIAVPDLH